MALAILTTVASFATKIHDVIIFFFGALASWLYNSAINSPGTIYNATAPVLNTTFIASKTVARSAFDFFITEPLRIFYFVGPIWGNLEPTQICFELTQVDSAWWNATADRRQECDNLLAKRYGSFQATVLCTIYFIVVLYIVVYFTMRCCFLRPLVRELKEVIRRPMTPKITKTEEPKS